MKLPIEEVFLSDTSKSYQYHVWQKEGKIRKIYSKLFTQNMTDDINQIVRRNLWDIVKLLYPSAIIADRTALELKPAEDGSIFVISDKKRPASIGNITIKPRKGTAPLDNDKLFMGNLYLPSTERALLENLRGYRSGSNEISRCLKDAEIEEYLDKTLSRYGDDALNNLRDNARKISAKLELSEEFNKLNKMISALLQTRQVPLESNVGNLRQSGLGYDSNRVTLFHKLAQAIESYAPNIRYCREQKLDNLYFYESYFSNYIEGTKFEVSEAKEIIFSGKVPENRPADAHDILGTFKVVSNDNLMKQRYHNFDEFLDILKRRHALLMSGRPDKNPGTFKSLQNQAGSTLFVTPRNVIGTLNQGFDIYKNIDTAFGRAVFMMFMISEVHPFDDGNGRTGRVMMNAELAANDEYRIIIPNVYRNNYISSLRAMTNDGYAEALLKTLNFAQKYTQMVGWRDFDEATAMLQNTHAFMDANEADENGIRLELPR